MNSPTYTMVHSRFQVIHADHGLLYSGQTKEDVLGWAEHWLQREPTVPFVMIYDAMAHVGSVDVWKLIWVLDEYKLIEYEVKG